MKRFQSVIFSLFCFSYFSAHASDYKLGEDGSYETKIVRRTGPRKAFTVFLPKELDTNDKKYSVITWGNGTFATPFIYKSLLKHFASHGFIVVASNSTMTGSGKEMLKGVDWIIEQSKDEESPFFDKLTGKVCAAGHSQGGLGAIQAAKDERVSCVIPLMPAFSGLGSDEIHGPAFFISAEKDQWVSPEKVLVGYEKTEVDAVYAMIKGKGHFVPQGIAPRDLKHYMTAWFLKHLSGKDMSAVFEENEGEIFEDEKWEAQQNF